MGWKVTIEEPFGGDADYSGDDLKGKDPSTVYLVGKRLRDIDLAGANLGEANFSNAKFLGGTLDRARLWPASLVQARFDTTSMAGAEFSGGVHSLTICGDTRGTIFVSCNLQDAVFVRCVLRGAHFVECNLIGAVFRGSKLDGAIFETSLAGADFRGSSGLIIDGHDISNARFDPRSKIPWHILRRKYTGVMTAFHLLLATVALGPYFGRTLMAEVQAQEIGIYRIGAFLGWHLHWTVVVSSTVLVTYNLLRLAFTWWLSQIREEEARSSYAPRKREYWPFWMVHQWFMRFVEGLALCVALWRIQDWATELI